MEFRILGSLEVLDAAGQPVALGGRARALLALLLLHANETVPVERLIDELWAEQPPASARNVAQTLVWQLRKTLGDRLETHGQGYRLRVEPDELDLDRFRRLVQEARRARDNGDPSAAAGRLHEALSLWRGTALADLGHEELAAGATVHLDELRLAALEERIAAELELGRDGALVSELEQLVAEQPLRERLRGQLMLALYRAGRQADALAVYRQARSDLVEQLGLEPGEELQRLEQAILRHDPALDPHARRFPDREADGDGAVAAAPARLRHRRRAFILLGLGVVAAAVALGLELVLRGGTPTSVAPYSVAVINASSGRLLAAIRVGSRPVAVAAGAGAVWVANADDGTVSRIDPTTRKVVQTIGTGTPAADIAVGAGAVWLAGGLEGRLIRIDPATNAVVDTIDLSGPDRLAPTGAFAVVTGGGAVWVASGDGSVLKIDPATDAVVARTEQGPTPVDLAFDTGNVWVVNIGGHVLRIDSGTGEVTGTLAAAPNARAIAVGAGGTWVTDAPPDGRGLVWRIDPATVTISGGATKLLHAPAGIATGGGVVWVAGGVAGTMIEIAPGSGDVIR